MPILSTIADIIGILSFILTIILLIRSESLRKEIDSQKSEYQKSQKSLKVNMISLRDTVREDQIISLRIISEIRTQLFSLEQKFGRLLTRKDKQHLHNTLAILNSKTLAISKNTLCEELDYFIARLERREIS